MLISAALCTFNQLYSNHLRSRQKSILYAVNKLTSCNLWKVPASIHHWNASTATQDRPQQMATNRNRKVQKGNQLGNPQHRVSVLPLRSVAVAKWLGSLELVQCHHHAVGLELVPKWLLSRFTKAAHRNGGTWWNHVKAALSRKQRVK